MAGGVLTGDAPAERYRTAVMSISELFLDTEHDARDFAAFARRLRGLS